MSRKSKSVKLTPPDKTSHYLEAFCFRCSVLPGSYCTHLTTGKEIEDSHIERKVNYYLKTKRYQSLAIYRSRRNPSGKYTYHVVCSKCRKKSPTYEYKPAAGSGPPSSALLRRGLRALENGACICEDREDIWQRLPGRDGFDRTLGEYSLVVTPYVTKAVMESATDE